MLHLYTCNFNYLICTVIRCSVVGVLFFTSYSITFGQDLFLSSSERKLVVNSSSANKGFFYRVAIGGAGMLEDINHTQLLECKLPTVALKKEKTIELTLHPHGGALLFG